MAQTTKLAARIVVSSLLLLAVLFGGSALFIREVKRFKLGAKASEAKANLKALSTAQRAYYAERDTYVADLLKLGFRPERKNRYAYFLAAEGPALRPADLAQTPAAVEPAYVILTSDADGADAEGGDGALRRSFAQTGCPVTPGKDAAGRLIQVGVTPGLSGGFVAVAAGRLRLGDRRLDCWSIASMVRTAANGETIAAGEPFHEFNAIVNP